MYVERLPVPALAGVVRTVWVQRTGDAPYVQRHLPTGGVELHFPVGGRPRLLGPLTAARLELLPARTTLVGVRYRPGAAPPLPVPLDDLVDRHVDLADLWGSRAERLAEACAGSPGRALAVLQARLPRRAVDPLVTEAMRLLMPWHPAGIDSVAGRLALSPSQLRRRCLQAVGVAPKTLQRTLRFQGFLALAQAGAGSPAGLAADAGYADQAHLSRECLRLTGLTPRALLGGSVEKCACGHDHSASYLPFLRDSFKNPPPAVPSLTR
ncbi:helix-turn-helix domain-containing protein [Amycolatopsis sp. DG1A-15b]|uniref:helix-turn-helix domain-containing protein n=1 Tax=Amycolatopsis sp. DG1A-15b TaxID=3052846 RepID=UPI00255BA9BE|nr:helix-turn-helix domain-containing protein [Amycolatopsis sp. DG1A-15b]WIX87287.1 helix-turn-helix domain-containing protein [Amycolatopsis sp. DG1A-15b]